MAKPSTTTKTKAKRKTPTKAKGKSGRKCTACHHADVKQINTLIHAGRSFRAITSKFGVTRSSLQRHTENCLKIEIAALIEQKKEEQAIDVYKEFEEQLNFAKKLRIAAEQYLSDPLDPLKLAIIPRANEIDVVYYDNTDLTEGKNPQPKKKQAQLAALIHDVEEVRNLEVDKVSIKTYDLRKFALDAINTADVCIDKFAKLGGMYQQARENERNLENTIKAMQDFLDRHPDYDRQKAIEVFSQGRTIPATVLEEHFGIIG